MRGWSFIALVATSGWVSGQEPFPARTGSPFPTPAHTHKRAGTATPARFIAPSIQKHDGFGLVNGMTFGSDYLGFGRRPGRIFPGLWPSKNTPVADRYRSDGPISVPDPVGSKPLRKAVAEARHDRPTAPEGR